MDLKIDIMLIIIGGLIRAADIISDLSYIATSDFDHIYLYYACWATTFITPGIMLCITIFNTFKQIYAGSYLKAIKTFGLGVLFTVLDPIGILLLISAVVVYCIKSEKEVRAYIEITSKLTGFLEAMTESIPQIVIQLSNNLAIGEWSIIGIVSIFISISSILYSLFRLFYLYYQYTHHEDKKEIVSFKELEVSGTPAEDEQKDFTFHRENASRKTVTQLNGLTKSPEVTYEKVMYRSSLDFSDEKDMLKSASGTLELAKKPRSFGESRMKYNRITPSLEIVT